MSLHKTHICVVKSLVKIAAVNWHSLRRFIKPAPDVHRILLSVLSTNAVIPLVYSKFAFTVKALHTPGRIRPCRRTFWRVKSKKHLSNQHRNIRALHYHIDNDSGSMYAEEGVIYVQMR